MFYPTCYVYKIGSNDESSTTNENTKKSDVNSMKKTKNPPSTTPLDLLSNSTKTDNALVKNLSNQLLISAQRTNCVDLEKK